MALTVNKAGSQSEPFSSFKQKLGKQTNFKGFKQHFSSMTTTSGNEKTVKKNVFVSEESVEEKRGFVPSDVLNDPGKREFLTQLSKRMWMEKEKNILKSSECESSAVNESNNSMLQKIMTPAAPQEEFDSGSLKRRDPKKMFTDSSFYNSKYHPTIADQVEMAHRLSSAMFNEQNKGTKGAKMYLSRMEHSGGFGEDIPKHDNIPNMKLVMNPEGKVHVWDDLPADQRPDLGQLAVHAAPSLKDVIPETADPVAESLNAGVGRGGALFAKRKEKAASWIVDDSTVGRMNPGSAADKFIQEQSEQQLVLQQQKMFEQQQKFEQHQQQVAAKEAEQLQQQREAQAAFMQQQQFKQEQSMEVRRIQEAAASARQEQLDLPPNFQHANIKGRPFTPSLDLGCHNVQGINVWANTAPRGWGSAQRSGATPVRNQSNPPSLSVQPATPSVDKEAEFRMQQEEQIRLQQQEQMRMQQEEMRRQEEEMRMQQEEQLRLQQEEQLRRQEEEMRMQQEEQMRRQEEEMRRQQEEQMRRQEEEMRRQQEEQMRMQQEQEMRRQEEEQMRIQQEQMRRQQEEQQRRQEEEMRRQQEEQMRRQQEEQMRIQQEEQLRYQQEQLRIQQEEQIQRQQEMQRMEQEQMQMRLLQEEQQRQQQLQLMQQQQQEQQQQQMMSQQQSFSQSTQEQSFQQESQQSSSSYEQRISSITKAGGFSYGAIPTKDQPRPASQQSQSQQSFSKQSVNQTSYECHNTTDQVDNARRGGRDSAIFGGINGDANSLVEEDYDYKKHSVKDLAKHFALVKPKSNIPHNILPEQRMFNGEQAPQLNYLGAGENGGQVLQPSQTNRRELSQQEIEASKQAYELKKKQQMEAAQSSSTTSSSSTVVRRTETSSEARSERRMSLRESLMLDPAKAHTEAGLIDPSAILRGSNIIEAARSTSEGLSQSGQGETDKVLNKWDNHNTIARGWAGVKANYHPVTFRNIYNVETQKNESTQQI